MERPVSRSLHFGFHQILEEGMLIEFEESFSSLYRPQEQDQRRIDALEEVFFSPICGRIEVQKVGSKVDVRGNFHTRVRGSCDRCTGPVERELSGEWAIFLMPQAQFSKHDKPGGKVIHGPTRDQKPSRHRSASKAPVLTDAEGEHEDVNFGAFDGQTVDLRGVLREELILELPMRFICSEACKGLCICCGQDLNRGPCTPECAAEGQNEPKQQLEEAKNPLAAALARKFQK